MAAPLDLFCRPLAQRTDPPSVCTAEIHAALKADPVRWARLRHIGMRRYEYGDGTSELLEHRNCECGTTLVRVVDVPSEPTG
jgi:hypothetical protein